MLRRIKSLFVKPKIERPSSIYHDVLTRVMDQGTVSVNERTGVETRRIFGLQMEFDLSAGFPLIAERKVPYKATFAELMWFLKGDTNARTLNAMGAKVWDQWAIDEEQARQAIAMRSMMDASEVLTFTGENQAFVASTSLLGTHVRDLQTPFVPGYLGPIYNDMWRRWPGDTPGSTIDQITAVYEGLRDHPNSRRLIVSGWNPAYLPDETLSPQENVINGKQSLAPCHTLFQFYSEELDLLDRLSLLEESAYAELDRVFHLSDLVVESEESQIDRLASGRLARRKRIRLEDTPSECADPVAYATLITTIHSMLDQINIPRRSLSLKLYARSQDLPLGTVFNVAQYAAMLHLFAAHLNMLPHRYIHTMGDAHVYANQYNGVEELLSRPLRPFPTLRIGGDTSGSIFNHSSEDFIVEGYDPDSVIKFPITV